MVAGFFYTFSSGGTIGKTIPRQHTLEVWDQALLCTQIFPDEKTGKSKPKVLPAPQDKIHETSHKFFSIRKFSIDTPFTSTF